MRFSRTNMRLAAARCRSLSSKIGVQTAEFSITAFCWRNADSRKSRTYERHNAEIRLQLFNLSQTPGAAAHAREPVGIDAVGLGPALRDGATVRELLPALVQAGREGARGGTGPQAL